MSYRSRCNRRRTITSEVARLRKIWYHFYGIYRPYFGEASYWKMKIAAKEFEHLFKDDAEFDPGVK